jgi:hypothetical protein
LIWAVGIVLGLSKIAAYSRTPAPITAQPQRWPARSTLAPPARQPVLVVSLHPRCSCSRATLEELNKLMARNQNPLEVRILVYQPSTQARQWAESEMVQRAGALPGVHLIRDVDGVEALRFGLDFSGATALYAPAGQLLFSGGITGARGHIGDNAGESSILALLAHQATAIRHSPVFGCSIKDGN